MKSFIALLLPLALTACQASSGPDFTPIKQGLGFLGLSLILAAFIRRTSKDHDDS